MESPRIRRAIVSVSDKSGLEQFARRLVAVGIELFSTGGTRTFLERAGIPVTDISSYTGFPEMMDGRLKTLHPKVHGGILCRHDHPQDLQSLEREGISTFELVVVNLYPFAETIARPGVEFAEAVENIDIGGPTMVRAAAKNHLFTTIACEPRQYEEILAEIEATGITSLQLRRKLAGEAFAHTARYDTAIASYFAGESATFFPTMLQLGFHKKGSLRYGENPHQEAALYSLSKPAADSLVSAEVLHGKELSYNNYLDLDSALGIVRAFSAPAAVVIKHNNPCGAAAADTISQALRNALDGDPLSAFGSVLGLNRPLDREAAEILAEPGLFVEAIIAPDFEAEAFEILTTRPKWKANVRLLKTGSFSPAVAAPSYRMISGGLLVQDADLLPDPEENWKIVGEHPLSEELRDDLTFAWEMVRHVKSNAIVVAKNKILLGAGAGQMSRIDSTRIALEKAGSRAEGGVLASDAFFPFPDSIETAAAAGIRAIVEPGGSKKDDEVIAACNRHGIPILFTGRRHFKH